MIKQPFYYSEGPYLRILQSLYYELSNTEAFVLLMGDDGVGKSTLCEKLSLYMERKGNQVVFFEQDIESPDMLRSLLAKQFDLPSPNNIGRLLEDALSLGDKIPYTLIFDNAHNLSDISLVEIHRLSEIQVNSKRALNIVLCGSPSLEKRLQAKLDFTSLRHSVSNKVMLKAMTKEEQPQFLEHYLLMAKLPNLKINNDVIDLMHRTCKGYPEPTRLLCQLIDDTYRSNPSAEVFDKARVSQLIRNSELQALLPNSQLLDVDQLKIAAPVAAVFTIGIIAYLFQALPATDSNVSDIVLSDGENENTNTVIDNSPFEVESQSIVMTETSSVESEPVSIANVDSELVNDTPSPMPSLLRPAPVFSLDDEEEPVSDSSLALVTAAEIGLDLDALAEAEFEDFDESVELVESVALIENEVVQELEPSVAVEPAVAIESPVESTETQVETSDVVLVDSPAETDALSQVDPIENVRVKVDEWVLAWETKNLDDYFASYHPDFEPRYESSLSRWQQSRTRVIGNAVWIKLALADFELVSEEDNLIEVTFWLDYESPTYRDSTLKKIILSNTTGSWLILEEVNLRVRS